MEPAGGCPGSDVLWAGIPGGAWAIGIGVRGTDCCKFGILNMSINDLDGDVLDSAGCSPGAILENGLPWVCTIGTLKGV